MGAQYERKKTNSSYIKKTTKSEKKPFEKKWIPLIVLAAIVVIIAFLLSPIFSISEIKISAVSLYSSEEIAASLKDFQGKNGFLALLENTSLSNIGKIFDLRMNSREKDMMFDYPLLKEIEIEYDLPDKIIVKIEERTPVMLTEKDGMYLSIDSEGYLLGTYTQYDKADMPIVEGILLTDYKTGAPISDGKDKSIDNSIKICSIMKQLSMLSYIDIIDVSDYNNIRMYCAPSLTIEFGDADDIGRKLSYVKGIIDSGYDGNSNGVLYVSSDGAPFFKSNSAGVAETVPETVEPTE